MKSYICLMLPVILALAACSSNAPKPNAQPDWIVGQSAQYPQSRYLLGHGQADTLAVARDRARADLAKTFSVQVSEQSKDTASFSQTGAAAPHNALDVSRAISTHTDEVLRGVEIADTWQNPDTHAYYALAVLPRAHAAMALRTEIASLDANTRSWLNQARTSTDLLTKIAAATHAVTAQTTRAGLQQELAVVDITGHGVPSPWALGKLQADKAALLARLKITPAADGGDAAELRQLLAGALANAGFTVGDGGDYTMTAHLDYMTLPPRDGWYWISGTLQLSLDGAGHAHGVRRWKLKVSGTDAALVKQRLMDAVAQDFSNDIQATVMDFAGGTGATAGHAD
ncbi:MAG TPA: LPP20 family lipoprotein [Gammaproteobacteria bacterium]|nr:LPP20 family lipoprotein [Gammaproteobacteria bacterium]